MNEIEYLLNNGFKILKLIKNTVIPASTNGLYDARDDWKPHQLEDYNLGIRCGAESNNLIILDVENRPDKPGLQELEKLEEIYGKLPETVTAKSRRGGRHFYFIGKCRSRNMSGTRYMDIISDGKYAAMPPSSTELGDYEWVNPPGKCAIAPLPEWILKEFDAEFKIKSEEDYFYDDVDESNVDEFYLERLLDYLDPDCDYDQWIRIGMSLHSTKSPWAFKLFNNWSAEGKKYKGVEEIHKKWESFGKSQNSTITYKTICYLAQPIIKKNNEIFFGNMFKKQYPVISEPEPSSLEEENFLPLPKSGFLREIYDAFIVQSRFEHKEFAMGASIAILSTLFQRSASILDDNCTSTFGILVGNPTCGKDFYISSAKQIIAKCMPECMLDEIRSSQGLKKALTEFESRAMVEDESLDFLKRAYDKRYPDQTAADVAKLMLELWNHLSSMAGSQTKKKEDCIKSIDYPRLTYLSVGTEQSLIELLAHKEIVSKGLLSRCDLWFAEGHTPKKFLTKKKDFSIVENKISDFWKNLKSEVFVASEGKKAGLTHGILQVGMEASALKLYQEFDKENDAKYDYRDVNNSIYRRIPEKVLRFSAINALSNSRSLINLEDLEFAIPLAEGRVKRLFDFIENKSVTSELHEIEAKVIKTLGTLFSYDKKTNIYLTRISERCSAFKKLPYKDKLQILNNLESSGIIQVSTPRNQIIKSVTYLKS